MRLKFWQWGKAMNFLGRTRIRILMLFKSSSFVRCCASESTQLMRFWIWCTKVWDVDITATSSSTHPYNYRHQLKLLLNHAAVSVPLHCGQVTKELFIKALEHVAVGLE
jgi:hypothetical protein